MIKSRLKTAWIQAAAFLAVLGPGLITGSVDNDAGGITTYSVLGARFGYRLLWILIPSFLVLVVVQEMNARMGMVTRKGLADLIREKFGVRITFLIFIGLFLADIGNTATEFAGIAGSMEVFHVSKYVSVPLSAMLVWFMVVKGTYKSSEKIFLVFSIFLFSYVVSAVLAKPDWGEVGHALVHPAMGWSEAEVSLVVGTIGTTIAPWMQFYMQSAVIEKGLTMKSYRYEVCDVILGSVATVVVAFFIVVACAATLHPNGIPIEEAKDAARALQPLAGALAGEVFALGLFVASIFAAAILPIATAFYVCEAFGFEAGINKKIHEAPQFYALFTFIMAVAVGIILLPGAPLIRITIWTQVINAMLLPVVLISMILMVNDPKIMGEHVNNRFQNWVGWGTTVILVALTGLLLVQPVVSAARRLVG